MNLNKIFYSIAKTIKKIEFRLDYIEDMGILSVPHKLCQFKIDEIVDVNEYINLYIDSEYYNIANEEIEKINIDEVSYEIFNKIIDCYINKIYDYISNCECYMGQTENYYLTAHLNNQLYSVISEYIYSDGCFISGGEVEYSKLEKVFR